MVLTVGVQNANEAWAYYELDTSHLVDYISVHIQFDFHRYLLIILLQTVETINLALIFKMLFWQGKFSCRLNMI